MTFENRIGLLTPGWPGHNTPNGIATSVFNLATGLQEIGKTPVIIAQAIDGPCPADIPVITPPKLGWKLQERIRSKFGDTGAVHRHIATEIAAAVNQAAAEHGLGAFLMEETNGWPKTVQAQVDVPVFVTLHGPWTVLKSLSSLGAAEDAKRERRENTGFRAAAGIIAPSRNVLASVEGVISLPDTPKIVLPNSFACAPLDVLASTLPERRILFVGRADYLKGADTVLDAFARLSETHPGATLTFVGPDRGIEQPDGSKLSMSQALAKLPDHARANIHYTGPLSREEVASLRTTHAIALIASRYENLNYTLLEAMAAGQSIVSTAVGGPAEVLTDGKTALMVPPGDAGQMATALQRLLEDPALTQHLGEAARTQVERDFSPRMVATQTADFIEGILNTLRA